MVEKEMFQNILLDDVQEFRDGLTERKLHEERILRRSSYGWTQPMRDQDGVGKFVSPIPSQREMEISQVGLMGYDAGHMFSSCCLPGSLGPLRFVAQNLRIQSIFEFRELFQGTACV